MLITENYKRIQGDLHARYDYGKGVDAPECAKIVKGLLDGGTVLDYGCGQGHLARLLDSYEVEEYDPCIDGKDENPANADVVVCADVLEHIEPECLDDVLLHIRVLTKKFAIFVIATGSSKKVMSDGRQAHLIVEDQGFWFQKLTGMFTFERFEDRSHEGRGLLIIAKPREFRTDALLPIARVRSTTAVGDDVRNANVRINCEKIKDRLDIKIAAHDRAAHLACYGPSLEQSWPSLALARARGEDIFSVSGAHKFLLDRSIVPLAHLDCDPREHKVGMIGEPCRDVQYWLASCVNPSYLDRLDGYDVKLWHSYNGKASMEAFTIDPGHKMIVGGGSIGLRAMSVLYCRGYRYFEIHGMDCSFIDDKHHAGPHTGNNKDAVPVKCGERWFSANAVMLLYAGYFRKQLELMKGATVSLHGDGLLQHMMKMESTNG